MGQDMITITDSAAEELKKKTALNPDAIGIRLSVVSSGCSGYQYNMEHVLQGEDVSGDDCYEKNGAVLFVPKTSFGLIGTEVDFEGGSLESRFVFNNPNAENACGCGTSFSIKNNEPG